MATQLFFLDTSADWSRGEGDTDLAGTTRGWLGKVLSTSRGAGVVSNIRTTVAGPTNGLEFGTSAASPWEWVSHPLDQDVTISGSITANLWGSEDSMATNAGFGIIIERLNSQGARVSTIMQNNEIGIELAVTTPAVRNEATTPTSTNMLKGDRFRVRVYADDAVTTTLAVGSADFRHNGTTAAADGDSYITFTETFGFLTTAPSGSVLYLTDTASAVDPNGASYDAKEAWTTAINSSVLATTSTVTGPTAPLQATVSGGGNFLEWFTKQLTAFTLSGLVACKIPSRETSLSANAALRVEIAVCASDGTSPVVWGAATDGTELTTTTIENNVNVAGDDVAVTDGQRLRIRVYFDDAPGVAMATAFSASLTYQFATSGGGALDCYVVLPQTVTEYSAGAAASLIYDSSMNSALLVR
jgi:hypothetical protein